MNAEYILKMSEPYVRGGELTYKNFFEIFCMMTRREQYAITDILAAKNIELVDEYSSDFDPFEASNENLCAALNEDECSASRELCERNVGLVGKLVRQYFGMWSHDLTADDLMQEGMIGLLMAAKKFRAEFGCRFSTYATFWIRQSIIRAIYDRGFTVRLPVNVFDRLKNFLRASRELLFELGREPKLEELADRMKISVDEAKNFSRLIQLRTTTSLDTPLNDESETTFGETIADESYELEEDAMKIFLREEINAQLQTIHPREAEVIRLRFGLDGGGERTLEQIGKSFGVTRERIRQIEVKALKKLRHPSRSKRFKDFLH